MERRQENLVLLEQAENQLRQLSIERLLVAVDCLSYLAEREENEATQELLEIPGVEAAFLEARREAEAEEVIAFEQIRRNV